MTKVIARVHPVHLMNVDWAPGGRQPSDQANWLRLSVRRKLAATIHIHHRYCYYYSARKLILIYRPTKGGRLSRPRHCSKGAQPVPKAVVYIAVAVAINTTARSVIREQCCPLLSTCEYIPSRGHYEQKWCHPQNRKYIKYHKADRWGPSHGHG